MGVTEQLHRQRRRGEELEAALLQAAWDELAEVGFAKLTMESVAVRAKTGVAVLYRRWPNKDDLVIAAIGHYGKTRPVEIPDTGTLRGDMLGLLRGINDRRNSFAVVVSATFSACCRAPASPRRRCACGLSVTGRYGRTRSSAARTSAARLTWTPSPPPS